MADPGSAELTAVVAALAGVRRWAAVVVWSRSRRTGRRRSGRRTGTD